MFVHRSNRVEVLVELYAGLLKAEAMAPLQRDVLIVQGPGMEKWLAKAIAGRLGIWGGVDVCFPRAFMDTVVSLLQGDEEVITSPFAPERLRWKVYEKLSALDERPQFDPLRRHCKEDRSQISLAMRIADCFDRYGEFRPELLASWTDGEEPDDWQALLWREIRNDAPGEAPHELWPRLLAWLDHANEETLKKIRRQIGARVSIFALSALPPMYIEVLSRLSRCIPVHVFLFAVTEHFLGDMFHASHDGHAAEIQVHPLVASWGRVGREFQEQLERAPKRIDENVQEAKFFLDPEKIAAHEGREIRDLDRVQASCLRLSTRAEGVMGDGSIEIHGCCGALREIEALHDQILAQLDRNPGLVPEDFIVMAPRIDDYAPLIDAIFGGLSEPTTRRIPYRIADRSDRAQSSLISILMDLMRALQGRASVHELMDLLRREPVMARFELEAAGMQRIEEWIHHSQIRWGEDAKDRKDRGQPPVSTNSWRLGMDRLAIGAAYQKCDWADLELPVLQEILLVVPSASGSEMAWLGGLSAFVEQFFGLRASASKRQSIDTWCAWTTSLVDHIIQVHDPGQERELQRIRDTLGRIAESYEQSNASVVLDLPAFERLLEVEFTRGRDTASFAASGVTFCEMVPMRSIPFRVVGLLGMNDADFPRREPPVGFNRIDAEPRLGDRNPRDDDRYLFLEALLSAREKFMIFYSQIDPRDQSETAPAAVVTELLDFLADSSTRMENEKADSTSWRVKHPLQGFSRSCFDGRDPRIQSYRSDNFHALEGLDGTSRNVELVDAALPYEIPDEISLDAMIRYFRDPAREFAKQRLGLKWEPLQEQSSSVEAAVLEGLETFAAGQRLLEATLANIPREQSVLRLRASGALPWGSAGDAAIEHIQRKVEPLVAEARAAGLIRTSGESPGSWNAQVRLADVEIHARIPVFSVSRPALVSISFARASGKSRVAAWISHLFICATAEHVQQTPEAASLIYRAPTGDAVESIRWPVLSVTKARSELQALVQIYLLGQRYPLPFFPKTSFAYSQAIAEGKSREQALAKARAQWMKSGDRGGGERDSDPATQRLFLDIDPLIDNLVLVGEWPKEFVSAETQFESLALTFFAVPAQLEGEQR